MDYTIREFRDIDPFRIYELVNDVYTTSDWMSESFEEKFPTYASFEQFVEELIRRGGIALIAELSGELYGYLTIMPRYQSKLRHTSELNMGVHHTARGKGIGGLLLREALRQAGEASDLEIIYLMVRSDNLGAVRLYEKMGFDHLATLKRDTKTHEGYYDGLLMRKFINRYWVPGV